VTAQTVTGAVLAGAGVLVCVVASVGALVPRDILDRLHFLTPVTSVGVPLVGVGVAVDTGWHLTTAEVLFTVAVVALTGPVLAAATGRDAAEQRGLVRAESPE
jgi:multisubunit Na+/H+ antiporter MnhG subunit